MQYAHACMSYTIPELLVSLVFFNQHVNSLKLKTMYAIKFYLVVHCKCGMDRNEAK